MLSATRGKRGQAFFKELLAELDAMIHEAKEAYTGMEGVTPETDLEKYLMQVLDQMYEALREQPTSAVSDES